MDQDATEQSPTQEEQFNLKKCLENTIVFAVSMDPDTMYYHQAMCEPDKNKFQEVVQREIINHESHGHWIVLPRQHVLPKNQSPGYGLGHEARETY